MIALQSLRGSGLLVVLFLSGSSFALGFEEGEPPLAPTPTENRVAPVPIPDPGTASSDPFTITPDSDRGYTKPGMGLSTPSMGPSNHSTGPSNLGTGSPDHFAVTPVPGTGSPVPQVPVECQCRRCRPDRHRSRGFFGWFRGHSERNSIAEYNAMCSGCNVNPEPPFGTSYSATMQAQAAKGEAALMVLHHFDFVPCQGELNYRGRLQLQKIVRRALCNPFPIIIEASRHDPALDAARHAAVISELALTPVPMERVVIGRSPARGLDGLDAELIHLNLLRLTGGGVGQAPTGGAASGVPVAR